MTLDDKRVAVIGAGIAGLNAADALSGHGIRVAVIEKASLPGGHAGRLVCKAVDGCVQCGACLAQERLLRVARQPRISVMNSTRITAVELNQGFELTYQTEETVGSPAVPGMLHADALLLATGFRVYDPSPDPYGYGTFENVVTNLEAEDILRLQGKLTRPSDGRPPGQIAFIQCVGSRDSRNGHNWCSKICCPSALRMARLIQSRQPGTAVTFFYIDVQSFGRNFQTYYDQCRNMIRTIRAIPGDVVATSDEKLQVIYFDPEKLASAELLFDMVILSVGLMPSDDMAALWAMLGRPGPPHGFWPDHENGAFPGVPGLFAAGAALGPMSIAESIDNAGKTAADIVRYLESRLPATPLEV